MGQTGESEPDESQRIRELLTGNGYIFHGTRVTGLTWAYRLSGGNLRAVQVTAGLSARCWVVPWTRHPVLQRRAKVAKWDPSSSLR